LLTRDFGFRKGLTSESCKPTILCSVLSNLLRNTEPLFRIIANCHPSGKLSAMPECVSSRWHFLIDSLLWLLSNPDRVQVIVQCILKHFQAVSSVGKFHEDKLPKDALFVVYQLSSSITLLSLSVAADLGCATVKPELAFLQSGNGLHMASLYDFFAVTAQRRMALHQGAITIGAKVSAAVAQHGRYIVDAYRNNEISPEREFGTVVSGPAPSALSHLNSLAQSATHISATRHSTRSARLSSRLVSAAESGIEDMEIDSLHSGSGSGSGATPVSSNAPASLQVLAYPEWTGLPTPPPPVDDCKPELLFPLTLRAIRTLPVKEQPLASAVASSFASNYLRAAADKRSASLTQFMSPVHFISSIASANTGAASAKLFASLGVQEIIRQTAKYFDLDRDVVKSAAMASSYRGPLRLVVSPDLWGMLVQLGNQKQQNSLWTDPALSSLLCAWKSCFAPVSVSQDFAEQTVKMLAGLKGQQRQNSEIASRFLRNRANPKRSVLAVNRPILLDAGDSVWQSLKADNNQSSPTLRLRQSGNNPFDVAIPQLTRVHQLRYNARLGYNRKYTEQDKAQRMVIPSPAKGAQLSATGQLLRSHFAKRAVPPDPELNASGQIKRRKKASKKAPNGKDER
jgi:hypothetical protein